MRMVRIIAIHVGAMAVLVVPVLPRIFSVLGLGLKIWLLLLLLLIVMRCSPIGREATSGGIALVMSIVLLRARGA